jgi:hypothetical protein
MKKIMISLTNLIVKLIGALVAFLILALLLGITWKAGDGYAIAFLLFFTTMIFFMLLAEDLLMFILCFVGTFATFSFALYIVQKDSLPDAPRPDVKIAENYFQECNGNNLYVYKFEDRLSVEPSDIQVVANDASCTGEK